MNKVISRKCEELTPLLLMKLTKQALDNQESSYVISSVDDKSGKAQTVVIYAQNVSEPITYAHFKAILKEIERRHQNNEYSDKPIPWSDYVPAPQEKLELEFESTVDIREILNNAAK